MNCNCKWKYIVGTCILLPTSKNDEPKEVHLNGFAAKVLASIMPEQPKPDDLLFPDVTPEAVSMAFHRVCALLNISDIRLHDLRHTLQLGFATVELVDVIASQLGHRDLRMTKRYARIAASQVHQAVAGLDALLLPPTEEQAREHRHELHKRQCISTGTGTVHKHSRTSNSNGGGRLNPLFTLGGLNHVRASSGRS